MTPAQKTALARFAGAAGPVVPQYADIRKDVARALFDAGHIECLNGNDNFRGGYAPLRITDLGRKALDSSNVRGSK